MNRNIHSNDTNLPAKDSMENWLVAYLVVWGKSD